MFSLVSSVRLGASIPVNEKISELVPSHHIGDGFIRIIEMAEFYGFGFDQQLLSWQTGPGIEVNRGYNRSWT